MRLLAIVLLLPALTGCGGSVETAVAEPDVVAAAVEEGATVIDVRTPEEFAAGHLDNALNLDVQGPGFDDAIDALDEDAAYVVYCRTGRRSEAAVKRMAEAGFDDVVNGGGYSDLVDAGLD